ncbi:PEP-utilizing enzyme [Sphaerisporangium fuscum]|uniref:PEP-utilizing enzyme n=1 Tax=Sphaerisporangium fuscum TaxID=2835868 RepID=UPI001BDC1724|nr:PEP-utilizing enzyme [Sphaerisporangium fuscum]
MNVFGTKAETLIRLAPLLRSARVLPMVSFSVGQWRRDESALLTHTLGEPWADGPLVVRSSAQTEDSTTESLAGHFHSELGVCGPSELRLAVEKVLGSYGSASSDDQVLVQPQLTDAVLSGVACSCDPSSGAPYRVITWSEGADTTSVTRGTAGARTWYGLAHDPAVRPPDPRLEGVLSLLTEVIEYTKEDRCEIEFAVSSPGVLYLFQARPLLVKEDGVGPVEHQAQVEHLTQCLAAPSRVDVLGDRPIYGVMPDWNPAEIIGLRPRALARSLYQRLITDRVWAESRAGYGYRDVTGVPLMVDLGGCAYIDVRASFTSFVPADLDDDLAGRLVNHYLNRLAAEPYLHDKVEFEIVLSCNAFDLNRRLEGLRRAGFSAAETDALRRSLVHLTNEIISDQGPRGADLELVSMLSEPASRPAGLAALLDRCAEWGARPFAGLARAGFVAAELLGGLVRRGAMTAAGRDAFLASLKTVAADIQQDFASLGKAEFLRRYGHLRPGTYDILSPRYDEDPDRYFDWTRRPAPAPEPSPYRPGLDELRAIDVLVGKAGITSDAPGLLSFIAQAIKDREWAKFVFTGVLSETLVRIGDIGREFGLNAEELSHIEVAHLLHPSLSGADLRKSARRGSEAYARARSMVLPPLIYSSEDVRAFEVPESMPNFVTQGRAHGKVADIDGGEPPEGAIALVVSGDPGYDWILARGVAGLVTAYGGVNSHMAIRAQELGIPAVIGTGESRYRRWMAARALEIDCANKLVKVIP